MLLSESCFCEHYARISSQCSPLAPEYRKSHVFALAAVVPRCEQASKLQSTVSEV